MPGSSYRDYLKKSAKEKRKERQRRREMEKALQRRRRERKFKKQQRIKKKLEKKEALIDLQEQMRRDNEEMERLKAKMKKGKKKKGKKTKSKKQVRYLMSKGSPFSERQKDILKKELKMGKVKVKED